MAEKATTVPAVLAAVQAVKHFVATYGITKNKEVTGDGPKFHFRGIDHVVNTIAEEMDKAQLLVVPTYHDMVIDERKVSSGKANYNIKLQGTFKFLSLADGSELPIGTFFGEANDMADKASTKAQSVSLRTCLIQTFLAPTGPLADPEEDIQDTDVTKDAGQSQDPATSPQKRDDTKQADAEPQPIPDGKKRMLESLAKSKGFKNVEDVEKKFGAVNLSTYNQVMDKLKAHKVS